MNKTTHEIYNIKQKTFMEENPQNEVLQPCIKTEKSLTVLFSLVATAVDYTSDLEQICIQKFRSILDLYTRQALLQIPFGVFGKT